MINEGFEYFPLSKSRKIKGNRRIAREKVLQILIALEVSGTDLDILYKHIFYRDFNFGEEVGTEPGKLLTPAEIEELESDTPIVWQEDEVNYTRELIYQTVSMKDKIDGWLKDITENWEINRMAQIDRFLIHMATAELICFPEIPKKVTINEVLEISKMYSTDKSSPFINGVLDKMLDLLNANNLLNKSGKGLIEG